MNLGAQQFIFFSASCEMLDTEETGAGDETRGERVTGGTSRAIGSSGPPAVPMDFIASML